EKVDRFVDLAERLARASGPVTLQVLRSAPASDAAPVFQYEVLEFTVPPGAGLGAARFGLEPAELYVWAVRPGTPAADAGLRRGDRVVSLNGERLNAWLTLERLRDKLADEELALGYLRDGELTEVKLRQKRLVHVDEYGTKIPLVILGLERDSRPASYVDGEKIAIDLTALEALKRAFKVVPEWIRKTALMIAELLFGELSFKGVGGPLMMADIAAKSAENGWESYLEVMALISINLGLMNLIPIPALDGFHLLSAFWESIRRRPLSMRARLVANYIGVGMLLMLMALAMKNDITRMLLD
ncbi:MAG: site-2 protease family protein, partial [Myxococcales bacterium]